MRFPKQRLRDFVTLLIKRLLLEIIIMLSKKYPSPTEENVWHPNARILFHIQNEFLGYEKNQGRKRLFEAAFRIGIDEYQRHTFYQGRLDYLIEGIRESEWLPRSARPMSFWGEPRGKEAGTVFPVKVLSKIMVAQKPHRSKLIRDLIISAGEERVFEK